MSCDESFDSTVAVNNTNDNHMCVGGNAGTFASMALDKQGQPAPPAFYRPAKPFAPFDCTALVGGPVAPVILP